MISIRVNLRYLRLRIQSGETKTVGYPKLGP